jgi:hypothetical protein
MKRRFLILLMFDSVILLIGFFLGVGVSPFIDGDGPQHMSWEGWTIFGVIAAVALIGGAWFTAEACENTPPEPPRATDFPWGY